MSKIHLDSIFTTVTLASILCATSLYREEYTRGYPSSAYSDIPSISHHHDRNKTSSSFGCDALCVMLYYVCTQKLLLNLTQEMLTVLAAQEHHVLKYYFLL